MSDERKRLRAVERVRVGVVFLGLTALFVAPALELEVLRSFGVQIDLGYGFAAAVPELVAFAGVLLLAVPAYLFLLPARWFARANRLASVWWASVVFASAMALALALMLVLMAWGSEEAGLLLMAPLTVFPVAMGLLTWSLVRVSVRARRATVIVVLACAAFLTVGVGVFSLGACVAGVCETMAWPYPVWLDSVVMTRIFQAMGLAPLVLLIGSIVAFVGAHRLVTQIVREGECPECGYWLAGLKESGCPECGWGRESTKASAHGGDKDTVGAEPEEARP